MSNLFSQAENSDPVRLSVSCQMTRTNSEQADFWSLRLFSLQASAALTQQKLKYYLVSNLRGNFSTLLSALNDVLNESISFLAKLPACVCVCVCVCRGESSAGGNHLISHLNHGAFSCLFIFYQTVSLHRRKWCLFASFYAASWD